MCCWFCAGQSSQDKEGLQEKCNQPSEVLEDRIDVNRNDRQIEAVIMNVKDRLSCEFELGQYHEGWLECKEDQVRDSVNSHLFSLHNIDIRCRKQFFMSYIHVAIENLLEILFRTSSLHSLICSHTSDCIIRGRIRLVGKGLNVN